MKKSVKLSALCLCAIMLFELASCQGNPANSTATQTAIQTPKDTPSAAATPSATPENTATQEATPTPTPTPTPSNTASPSADNTQQPSQSPSSSATSPVQGALTFESTGESGLISIVQKLRAQNGMSEMTNTQQLNQVAQAIAEAIYAAGEEYRDAGDFSVLPDGTSMTDYLRSKGFSGHYTYSYWFHDYPTKGNTVNMLLNRAEASQDYFINRVTEGGYSSVGAASGIVQDGEYKDFTILVLFFAR